MKLFPRVGLDCNDVGRLSDAYVDRELGPLQRRQVFQHLARCEVCGERIAGRIWMKARVRDSVRALAVPPALFHNVCEQIRS